MNALTRDDVLLIAARCWGGDGTRLIYLYEQYAKDYFAGELHLTPVLLVPCSPYGHWVGLNVQDHNIYVMQTRSWEEQRGILLHEMIHEYLAQRTLLSKHDGQPWRDEIMRISALLGVRLWAGKYGVKRTNGKPHRYLAESPDGEHYDVVMRTQKDVARWPDSASIVAPELRATESNAVKG